MMRAMILIVYRVVLGTEPGLNKQFWNMREVEFFQKIQSPIPSQLWTLWNFELSVHVLSGNRFPPS